MRAITPDLEAILKARLQAGADGFRGRIDVYRTVTEVEVIDSAHGGSGGSLASSWSAPAISPANDPVFLIAALQVMPSRTIVPPTGWTTRVSLDNTVNDIRTALIDRIVSGGTPPYHDTFGVSGGTVYWSMGQLGFATVGAVPDNVASGISAEYADSGAIVTRSTTVTLPSAPTPGNVLVLYAIVSTYEGVGGGSGYHITGFTALESIPAGDWHLAGSNLFYRIADGTEHDITVSFNAAHTRTIGVLLAEYPIVPQVARGPVDLPGVQRISIDKSLRMTADQLGVEVVNDPDLGWGVDSVLKTNMRICAYQWFGDPANELRTFTGLIDQVHDHRDVRGTSLACRDMMAILLDQTFGATAPQTAGETGAVRTPANGVYLSMEVSAIVDDILDRAGWPVADRAITPTSYVLDEYVIADGTAWAAAIIGETMLAGLVGYDAWADEDGVFNFAPTFTAGALTEPGTPAYTFRTGEDIVALDDQTDQYDLRTRVKARGPMTTTTLNDTWRELWRTSKLKYPVGTWYDPADPANIRVIDRGTKRLYKIRQSDRAVLSSVYLGSVIPYPLGLSGDPADATVYWVLNAPWKYTGSTSGNSVKKVRKSDNHVLASYSIPAGRWSDLKVSTSYLWLTNLDTDRFYRRSKADGSSAGDYRHTYGGTAQSNPSGLMIDGTTLHVFWSNAGTTARFLIADTSAPGTVTDVIKTAGTVLVGGEMDTTTHTECWGTSDSLGLIAKFTLVAKVDMTNEVFAEVVDTALEDELGDFAGSELRTHDTHPLDAAHAYEIRRDTVDLSAITSLAQATETAMRRLDKLSQRRRVLDVGILGNPALQKSDLVRAEDPVTGIAEDFTIDTYRSEMAADGTYLGTLALIPVTNPDDAPDDDGEVTE